MSRALARSLVRLLGRRNRRRRPRSWGGLVVIVLIAAYLAYENRPRPDRIRIERVMDGDSLVYHKDGKRQEIRLYAIDCPEKAQRFGDRAKAFTADRATGEWVQLVVRNHDRYEREIADVYLEDGGHLNAELVEAGLAWWYRQHAEGSRTLAKLERAAKADRRGLWKDEKPVPPWKYRNQQRARNSGE